MKNNKKPMNLIIILFILCFSVVIGQSEHKSDFDFKKFTNEKRIKHFKYVKQLWGISDSLNKIILNEEIISKANFELSDIRIYGIDKENKFTNEIPFVINRKKDFTKTKDIQFKLLNQTNIKDRWYYTYEITENIEINKIKLNFENDNFDWKIDLEGSADNNNWFKIVDKYRIISIVNNTISYVFTDVYFNDCKYKYYRISLKSDEKPILNDCQIIRTKNIDGKYKKYNIKDIQTKDLKTYQGQNKNITEIKVTLVNKVPINRVKLNIPYEFDYYRNVEFSIIIDSVKTEKGYYQNIKNLTRRQISSLDSNIIDLDSFEPNNFYSDNLIITIFNEDNPKLKINSVDLFGAEVELICRFPNLKINDTKYFLFYGNDSIYAPNYDLQYFVKDIENIENELQLGSEIKNLVKIEKIESPLIVDQKWLWIIIIMIIAIIVVFSFKMLKSNNTNNV